MPPAPHSRRTRPPPRPAAGRGPRPAVPGCCARLPARWLREPVSPTVGPPARKPLEGPAGWPAAAPAPASSGQRPAPPPEAARSSLWLPGRGSMSVGCRSKPSRTLPARLRYRLIHSRRALEATREYATCGSGQTSLRAPSAPALSAADREGPHGCAGRSGDRSRPPGPSRRSGTGGEARRKAPARRRHPDRGDIPGHSPR